MRQIIRNIRLAAWTVSDHINEAPFVLLIQMLRRVPARFVRPIARLVSYLAPTSGRPFFLLASFILGRDAELSQRFEKVIAGGRKGRPALRAAEVALAAGKPASADRLLQMAASDADALATVARRKWYDGDMSGAVDILDAGTGGLAQQRKRLAAELRVFHGWRPKLGPVVIQPEERRVLHLLTNSVPHTESGYSRRSHSILMSQLESGWQPLAVTRSGYPVQIGSLYAKGSDVVDSVRYERILPRRMASGMDGRIEQQASELLKIARRFKPVVLHTTTHFVNGLVVSEVAKALDVPWVYEVRGQLADTWASSREESARSSERYKLFVAREAEIMRDADLVITLGEAMKQNILAAGVAEENILLAPNAVGGAYLQAPLSQRDAQEELGLDADNAYIGTVSSLVEYEGLDDLVTSFAVLAPQLPKLKLVLVGDGSAAPGLREQVRRLGLSDRTIFAGRVHPARARLYHLALDVFVVPRRDTAVTRAVTPLKPVEALASGRPVVASDLPALREIVHDHVNGRLTPAENPEMLAEVLVELLSDEKLRRRLGSAGREEVLATRTWQANAKAYVRAYETLASNYTRRDS